MKKPTWESQYRKGIGDQSFFYDKPVKPNCKHNNVIGNGTCIECGAPDPHYWQHSDMRYFNRLYKENRHLKMVLKKLDVALLEALDRESALRLKLEKMKTQNRAR